MPPRARFSAASSINLPAPALDPSPQSEIQVHSPVAETNALASSSRASTSAPEAQGEGSESTAGTATGKAGQGKKKSQRPSWSCTECTRRKIRCDRVVPGCNQCIKRNKVHLCRLDQDVDLTFGSGLNPAFSGASAAGGANQPRLATAGEYEAITRSVSVVRQRLYHLDRVIRAFVPQLDQLDEQGDHMWGIDMNLLRLEQVKREQEMAMGGATDGAESVGPTPVGGMTLPLPPGGDEYEPRTSYRIEGMAASGSNEQRYSLPPAPSALDRIRAEGQTISESDGEVEAAVTLEFLALGRDRKQDHFSRAELRRPSSEEDEPTSPALLSNNSLSATVTPWNGEALASSSLFPTGAAGGPSAASPTNPQSAPAHTSPSATTPFLIPADVLPSPVLSDALVSYSLDRVGWQHGAVHSGQFRTECTEFHSWGDRRAQLVNQAWLALYFAILCVGVKHMGQKDAEGCGIAPDEQKRLPKLYFDASISALHRAQFLSKHSIYAVQTIVILVVACQDVGGSDLIATLLACGIRIAQHLNIHRFSGDQEWEARRRANGVDPKSEQGVKQLIQREVRKRLWYALATEDWVSIPYRRAYAIFPSHFTTPLPSNCTDEDLSSGTLLSRSQDEPTPVSKILLSYQVAACIRRFFEEVNSTLTGEPSYELCLEVDKQIRKIIEDGPGYLKAEGNVEGEYPPWVQWFKHYWIMSVSHKLLICHRVFLGRSFRDPKYAYSRKAAIEASRSIIQELAKGSQLPYQHLWTIPYHTISASTTIILDIYQSSSSDPDTSNKRREVQIALEELHLLAADSQIAARGVQLLATLLAEEAKHRRPGATRGGAGIGADGRKRKASEMGSGSGDHERFGDVAKRVVSNSRTALSSTSGGGGGGSSTLSPSLAAATFPYFAPTTGGGGAFDQQSPVDSHLSDGSLTQDAFDAILQGLSGYSGGGGAAGGGSAGSAGFGGGGWSPGMAGEATADFWRQFDSQFEPTGLEFFNGSAAVGEGGLAFGGGDGAGVGGGGAGHLGVGNAVPTPW
ncbi:hypothetical protein JCM1841_004790 [Sporobolomyces salmonicolor]